MARKGVNHGIQDKGIVTTRAQQTDAPTRNNGWLARSAIQRFLIELFPKSSPPEAYYYISILLEWALFSSGFFFQGNGVFFYLLVKQGAVDAKQFGGLDLVVPGLLQGGANAFPFYAGLHGF